MKKFEKICEKVTEKKVFIVSLTVYILTVLPLLWMTKYTHLCADDFGYGSAVHKNYLKYHSLGKAAARAWKVAKDYYGWWQGTYSSIFLMAFQPGVFAERLYFLGPLFLLVWFQVCMVCFLQTVFGRLMKMSRPSVGLLCIISLTWMLQLMDTPVQAFYFYNAGIHYIFMYGIMLLMLSAQICVMLTEKKSRKVILCLCQILLGVILGGGNYITAFLYILLTICLFGVGVLAKKRSVFWNLPGLLAEIAGFLVSAVAPGNVIRADRSDGVGAVKSILLSFRFSLQYLEEHINLLAVIALILCIPLFRSAVKNINFKFHCPLLVALLALCLYAAMFTPTCYALGFPGAGRCRNIYGITADLFLMLTEVYFIGWLEKRELIGKSWTRPAKVIGTAGALLFAGSLILSGDANRCMTTSAVSSVYHKEAQLYHQTMLEREAVLKGKGKKVEVRANTVRPYLLFFDDITEDAEDWRNRAVASWYKKKSVAAK